MAHNLLTLRPGEHEIHSACSHEGKITEGKDMAANPYVQGWREWDERYADLILGKRNWQIAVGLMVIALVLALGIVWLSTRSRFVPYVAEMNKLGDALAAPSALTETTTQISIDRRMRYELAPFIRNSREVITDSDTRAPGPRAGLQPRALAARLPT